MVLYKNTLSHFRNFSTANFTFSPFLTIIIGENARGKTSLLESIYFSIFGVGFRETREEELLQWHEERAIVETIFQDKEEKQLFQISLQRIDSRVQKRYFVNKTAKTHPQYKEFQSSAVLFAPEQIDIITGSPEKRREYFNSLISRFDPTYQKNLRDFENAVRKRNRILEDYLDERSLVEELAFWNDYIEIRASYITQKRQEYVDYLNSNQKIDTRQFEITYLKNEFNKERLAEVFELEKVMHRTRIGPQKDDFEIFLIEAEPKKVNLYGSRSEQRLGVFWLKLNEIRYFESVMNKRPILLLDDVFSELDTKNKKLVLDVVKTYQTVLTTTEEELIGLVEMPHEIIRL